MNLIARPDIPFCTDGNPDWMSELYGHTRQEITDRANSHPGPTLDPEAAREGVEKPLKPLGNVATSNEAIVLSGDPHDYVIDYPFGD